MLQWRQRRRPQARNRRPRRTEPPLHGRVLLAEDDPDVQASSGLILREMSLEVEVADNGRAACDMAEQSQAEGRPYDLILMDIQMPRHERLRSHAMAPRARLAGSHRGA